MVTVTAIKHYQSCIADCTACASHCRLCNSACLKMDDVKSLLVCIKLTNECASICELAVKFMLADSNYADRLRILCADICNACAAACEKHMHMSHCANCASACRACAIVCLQTIN